MTTGLKLSTVMALALAACGGSSGTTGATSGTSSGSVTSATTSGATTTHGATTSGATTVGATTATGATSSGTSGSTTSAETTTGTATGTTSGTTGVVATTGVGATTSGSSGTTGTVGVAGISINATGVSFDPANCGGAAPGNQTITITNNGTATLNYSSSVSGTVFAIVSGGTGSLTAGSSANLVLSAAAVPASATAASTINANLTITSNATGSNGTIVLPLTETPTGATLVVTPSPVAFGSVSFGSNSSQAFQIQNTGNAQATVTVGTPTDAQFVLTGTSSALTLASLQATNGLSATYTPTAANGSSTASLTVAGAVCGQSASQITLSGKGVNGSVGVSGDLTFGNTPCNTAAAPETITITNSGTGSFTFTADLGLGSSSPFTISPSGGTVAGNSTATITVTPKAIPAAVANLPGNFGDAVTITTDVTGDEPHTVQLQQGAEGAILGISPQTLSFNGSAAVNVSNSGTLPFAITNTGNMDAPVVNVAVTDGPIYALSSSTLSVSAGAGPVSDEVTFTPADITTQTGYVTLTTATPLCQPLPTITSGTNVPANSVVQATGTGLNGVIVVSTSQVDFQNVPCGQSAPSAQTLTISNQGNLAAGVQATLNLGTASQFRISCVDNGTQMPCDVDASDSHGDYTISVGYDMGSTDALQPGDYLTVSVTDLPVPFPSPITPYTDTISINNGAANAVNTLVTVSETPQGAILSWPQGTDVTSFGQQPIDTTTASQSWALVNTGNAQANVTVAVDDAVFTIGTPTVNVPALSTAANVSATFTPMDTTFQTGNITVATSDVLCAPLPAAGAYQVTGQGTNGAVSIQTSGTLFSSPLLVNCGAAGATGQVTISNTGNQAFSFTAAYLSWDAGSPSAYTVGPVNAGMIDANSQVVLNLSAPPVPQSLASPTPQTWSDTLVVTTTGITGGPPPDDIQLSETSYGAILETATTNLQFNQAPVNGQSTYQFPIDNLGNAPAFIDFNNFLPAINNAYNPAVFSANQGQQVNPGLTEATLFFDPPQAQGWTGSTTLAVSSSTILCEPLTDTVLVPGTALTLAGTGVSEPTVSVTPSSVSFGNIPCGQTTPPGAIDVTVKNLGTTGITYSASLQTGTYYQLNGASAALSNIALAAGASATIAVSTYTIGNDGSASFGAGAYSDQLTITDSVGDSFSLQVSESPLGSYFTVAPANQDNFFGQSCMGYDCTFYGGNQDYTPALFTVQNTGNRSGVLAAADMDQYGDPVTFSPAPGTDVGSGVTQTFTGADQGVLNSANSCSGQSGDTCVCGDSYQVTVSDSSPTACNKTPVTLTFGSCF